MCKLQEVLSPFFFDKRHPFSATNLIVIESNLHTINHLPVTQVCLEDCESKSLAQCLKMFYVFFLLFFAIESKLLLLLTNKVQKGFYVVWKNPQCKDEETRKTLNNNVIYNIRIKLVLTIDACGYTWEGLEERREEMAI